MGAVIPHKWKQGIGLVCAYLAVSGLFAFWYWHSYDVDTSLYVVNSTLLSQKERERIAASKQAEYDLIADTVEAYYDLKLLQLTRYRIASESNSQRIRALLRSSSGACSWDVESRIFGKGTLDCELRRIGTSVDAAELLVTVMNNQSATYSTKLTVRTWSRAGYFENYTLGELRQFVLEGLDSRIHERDAELTESRRLYNEGHSIQVQSVVPDRLGYLDFLYFSFGVMSGMSTSDITPLSTQVRVVIMSQHLISVVLTAFAAFFLLERIEERRSNQQVEDD